MKDEQHCLTGLAAVITAITGLVVALQQMGVLNIDKDGLKQTGEVKVLINDHDGYTNVRSGPGTTYEIIARINEGEVFYTIPQENSDWWRIRTSDGKDGYMHRSRIKIIQTK